MAAPTNLNTQGFQFDNTMTQNDNPVDRPSGPPRAPGAAAITVEDNTPAEAGVLEAEVGFMAEQSADASLSAVEQNTFSYGAGSGLFSGFGRPSYLDQILLEPSQQEVCTREDGNGDGISDDMQEFSIGDRIPLSETPFAVGAGDVVPNAELTLPTNHSAPQTPNNSYTLQNGDQMYSIARSIAQGTDKTTDEVFAEIAELNGFPTDKNDIAFYGDMAIGTEIKLGDYEYISNGRPARTETPEVVRPNVEVADEIAAAPEAPEEVMPVLDLDEIMGEVTIYGTLPQEELDQAVAEVDLNIHVPELEIEVTDEDTGDDAQIAMPEAPATADPIVTPDGRIRVQAPSPYGELFTLRDARLIQRSADPQSGIAPEERLDEAFDAQVMADVIAERGEGLPPEWKHESFYENREILERERAEAEGQHDSNDNDGLVDA